MNDRRTSNDTEMAYAARYPGTVGYGAVMVDTPDLAKETAKFVAKAIRDGAAVERVSVEAAREGIAAYLKAKGVL